MDDAVKIIGYGAAGFLLKVLGDHFKESREHKRAIALSLADLLEIRARLVGVDIVIKELGTIIPIPEKRTLMQVVFQQFFPDSAKLHERYDESVTALARVDPLLAYRMRSKNMFQQLLRHLVAIRSTDPSSAQVLSSSPINELIPQFASSLQDAIIVLAQAHSRSTARKTEQALKNQNVVPEELVSFFHALEASIVEAAKAASAKGSV